MESIDYTLIWLISEWIILIILLVLIPIFFYLKYLKDKVAQDKEAMSFSIRYLFFFIFMGLNQFFYIINYTEIYRNSIPGWNDLFQREIIITLFTELSISSGNLIIGVLSFCAFIEVIFPLERYVINSEKFPITKFLLLGLILTGVLAFMIIFLQVPQTGENLIFQIFIISTLLIGAIIIIIGLILFSVIYLKLAINSTSIVRKKALLISSGIILLSLAILVGNLSRAAFIGTIYELFGPITFIIGLSIFLFGFSLDRKE